LALLGLPRISFASSNPDVVVIGAGAAGLAATDTLLKAGKNLSNIDLLAQKWGPISYFSLLFIMLIYFYNLDGTMSLLAAIFS